MSAPPPTPLPGPIKATGYIQLTEEMSLKCKALVAREMAIWGPTVLKQSERQLKRQTRTSAKLNNKVHLLHSTHLSRLGENAVSPDTQKQTQTVQQNKETN